MTTVWLEDRKTKKPNLDESQEIHFPRPAEPALEHTLEWSSEQWLYRVKQALGGSLT